MKMVKVKIPFQDRFKQPMTRNVATDVTQHCNQLQCSDTTEDKVKITIHESTRPKDSASWGKIGKFKRTARKNVYVSPRLLLPRVYEKTIGETVVIFKAKLSIEGTEWLQNKDALILVFRDSNKPYEPKAHMILPKAEGEHP